MLCENFKIQLIIFIRNFKIYNREYLPRTISEKFKNSQTRQIPEDYISKFSKPISRGPEKSKNSQRFSKFNFAITAIIIKIIFQNFQNYESHVSGTRNRNNAKVTNITTQGEKNTKIFKD